LAVVIAPPEEPLGEVPADAAGVTGLTGFA
jgi:hypothetical protein